MLARVNWRPTLPKRGVHRGGGEGRGRGEGGEREGEGEGGGLLSD